MPAVNDLARDRTTRIFRFLKAFHELRNPVPRVVTEAWHLWLDDAPDTKASWVSSIGESPSDADAHAEEGSAGLVLRVRRPRLSECPQPGAELEGWLEPGWHIPENDVANLVASRLGRESHEQFRDSPARVAAFKRWKKEREQWARNEIPLRRADRLFHRLYELHGRLQRESERIELVLGDGLLVWKDPSGDAHHPVLLQSVQLEFNPDVPEFRISELEREQELDTALLGCFPGVDGARLAKCREEVLRGTIHPLLGQATNAFFRRVAQLLHAKGVAHESAEKPAAEDFPQLYRRPVLFVRPRSAGFARIFEGILGDIEGGAQIPSALTRIAGIDDTPGDGNGTGHQGRFDAGDALLSKAVNEQQLEIIQRLHDHGAVLVQGPPGTGKSHTIANLIGHLLAHGQTVLVTSHTTKALGVLRDHVVEDLRPLCVSVLDSDVESRRQLEDAVTHISQRLSAQDKGQYSREAVDLADQRARLRDEVRVAKAKLRDARLDEYREVVAGTRTLTPCEAARQVAAGQSSDSWIPGRIDPAAALPLTEAEIADLYASHGVLTPADESDLGHPLPDVKSLMSPPRFERLAAADPSLDRSEWWTNEAEACEPDDLSEAVQRLASLVKSMLAAPGWQRAATAAAMSMDGGQQHWSGLADKLDEAVAFAASCSELLLHHDVRPPEDGTPATHEVVTTGILAFLERKGSFGFLAKLTNRDWARFVADTRVNGAKPRTEEHFRAIKAEATLRRLRSEVEKRWTGLMEPGGAPSWKGLGPTPETACSQFAAEIRRALDWHARQASPEIQRLRDLGLRWDALLEAQAPRTGPQASLERLIAALELAGSVMNGRIDAALVLRRDKEFKALLSRLRSEGAPSSPLQSQLAKATERRDAKTYRQVVERVETLAGLQAPYRRRAALLGTLEQIAPGWAAAIRARTDVHGDTTPPGDVRAAWEWAQLHSELESRGSRSLPELQATVHELESRLREVTTRLIDRRAWAAQVQRTDLAQRQALVGWLQLIKRIGKGTGKRVLELRAQAATRMRQCRSAVPVWIMPLSRVADSFDPGTRFDVVIMDEASQSDVMGLVALYLGKKVVVVGDHEQVSPSAVGQQLAPLPQLIEQYLTGIPNSALYDGRTSVYDLAMQSFGGLVCLTEHFRCLPDIIEFSNWLSYRGEIKPLREPSAADVTPYVVPHRVIDGARDGKLNISEARHVASLLVACTREPEYAAKTFGVISLLGDEQALVIDRFLREHLDEPEYMRRRVLCGNAAQFQGDERDVIFLSLVHASNGVPLTKLDQPMYQQRFNVAASRARDQLWVTYSLDPATDLQPGDLRRKLIEHALDPGLRARQRRESSINTESDLKRSVLELLVANRFRVRPQHSVGSYRIDMVVQGASGQRLAVECDGDRSQTLENLEQDMARQAVLERLGWKFVRIRGTQFHRNAEAAMAPVFKKLAELGIEPQAADASPALSSDLHRRVLARAASLLGEWKVTAPSDLAPEPVARDMVIDETSID